MITSVKSRYVFIIVLGQVLLQHTAFCQNLRVIDSLHAILRVVPSNRQFEPLNSLGFEFRYSFPDSTIYYCTKAYELGQQLKLQKMLSRPLSFIGLAYGNQGNYTTALDFHKRSLATAIEQQDTLQLAHSYNNIGRLFFDEGDLGRAYSNFLRALDLFTVSGDLQGIAYVHRSLADVFKSKKDFQTAIRHALQALGYRKASGDRRAITSAFMELGLVYQEMDSTPQAMRHFRSADSVATLANDRITKAELMVGMAEILLDVQQGNEALKLAQQVSRMVSERSNQKVFWRSMLVEARCLVDQKPQEAVRLLNMTYAAAERSGNLVFQRDAALLLGKIYQRQGNEVLSNKFGAVYHILDGRIQNADLNKEIEQLQFQLRIEKAERENESLRARRVQDESLIARQQFQNLLLGLAALATAGLAVLIWRVSRRRRKINVKLEEQNQRILEQREEITKQNEVLERNNRKLDELNSQKDNLMNIVAHDLKAPINRISGLVAILEREGELNKNQKEYVRLIQESTQAGLSLITDLLDVHAWGHQEDALEVIVFSPAELLQEMASSFQPLANAKLIRIEVEAPDSYRVLCDAGILSRIIENLLSNAIKFSPQRTVVTLKATISAPFLQLMVRDQGPGFSEADISQLYQKFRKLSARPTAGESSNGLGLAIVKILTERLGGVISLKTELGQGSEFTVNIPVEVIRNE
ncbi:MAG TPA: ATP-binding protein [Cyclobacteriaceae bacterium]|nr:ATP-binding protein [Cyclobacteriaceae bacterium]